MRIAILTNEYPPHIYGGAGAHVSHLVRELAALDQGRHELIILCFGEQREKTGNLEVEGIRADFSFLVKNPRHRKLLDTLFRNVLMTGRLEGVDIIHCHTWYTHLAGCLLKQLLGRPLVLTTHSLEPQRPWKAEQLGSGYRVSTWLERTAYRNAAKYGISHDKPYLLFVGRISHQKGITHLLQALELVAPEVQAVLCAADPDTPEIRQEVEQKVAALRRQGRSIVWLDRFLPPEELIPLYSQAALFVCPSIYEPFGIINLEAMACGTPVVASAVGGIREVVVHEETGLLVPVEWECPAEHVPQVAARFARDLAGAVNRLLADPERRAVMGRKARERAESRFSWTSVARRTLEYYQELAGGAGME